MSIFIFMCVCQGAYVFNTYGPGACRGQKSVLDSLGVIDLCEAPHGCWPLNLGPLQEQPVLLTPDHLSGPALVRTFMSFWFFPLKPAVMNFLSFLS
jgi:hypothetical protein